MARSRTIGILAAALLLGLAGCGSPYDPGDRALSGGLIGAGAGAAIGSLSGDAGAGALIGGAVGALGGAVTTPSPPYAAPPPAAYYGPAPGGYDYYGGY